MILRLASGVPLTSRLAADDMLRMLHHRIIV